MSQTRQSLWSELRRRHVVRVGAGYVVAAVAVGGAADVFLPGLGAPEWALRTVLALLLLGFPLAVALSWAYDLTSQGVVRDALDSGRALGEGVTNEASPTVVGATEQRKSVIVLPFEDLSSDPDNGYFGDGLTDEVISDLSKLSAFRVVSRHSAMKLKGTGKDTPTIAADLGVSHVLSGSVRRVGDALRITAELAEGATDTVIWSDKYTGTMADVFDFQETLARQIAEALQVAVTPREDAQLSARPITNLRAYEAYLLARQECHTYTLKGLIAAEQHLDRAAEEVGETAWLLAARALVEIYRGSLSPMKDPAVYTDAERYAGQAVELDPQNAAAHTYRGLALSQLPGQYGLGIQNLRRALELDPNDRDATMWLGTVLANVGRPREATPLSRAATRLDPLSPLPVVAEAWVDLLAGRVDESFRVLDRALSRFPDEWVVWFCVVMMAHPRQRRLDEMATLTERIIGVDPGAPLGRLARFMNHAAHGNRDLALSVATPEFDAWARGDWQLSIWAAEAYALVGDSGRALEMLESAVPLGFINYPFLAEYNELLQPLWEETRGRTFLAHVKHEWETFEVG